jgi:hypothetical protein
VIAGLEQCQQRHGYRCNARSGQDARVTALQLGKELFELLQRRIGYARVIEACALAGPLQFRLFDVVERELDRLVDRRHQRPVVCGNLHWAWMRDARALVHASVVNWNVSASRCAGKLVRNPSSDSWSSTTVSAKSPPRSPPSTCPRKSSATLSPAYVAPFPVLADAVYSDDVAEVLDGPRPQQRLPRGATPRRPVGHIEQHVVVAAVAAPYGEAQVVADERTDTPPLEFNDQATIASRVVLLLVRHAKQVPLVVMHEAAVGCREQQAVEMLRAVANDQAARDRAADRRRFFTQPPDRRSIHCFGEPLRLHGETRPEHLRQHDEVRVANEAAEMRSEPASVLFRVLPGQVSLDHRDAQVRMAHSSLNRAAAASSVASCFAKQKRTMRSPGGAGDENTEIGIAATPFSRVRKRANSTSGKSLMAE